jgi:hypothetical protein
MVLSVVCTQRLFNADSWSFCTTPLKKWNMHLEPNYLSKPRIKPAEESDLVPTTLVQLYINPFNTDLFQSSPVPSFQSPNIYENSLSDVHNMPIH